MNTTKDKGRAGWRQATLKSETHAGNHTLISKAKQRIASRLWAIDYGLEVTRQHYADRHQVWRQAGVCVLIGVLRFAGVAS
jgi:hypothetical protein